MTSVSVKDFDFSDHPFTWLMKPFGSQADARSLSWMLFNY
jgi:hypothetical protein